MDTFTTLTGVMVLALIYFGERFKTGAYFIMAAMFDILFAWRMAEEVFYIASASLIFFCIYRTFFDNEDVRGSNDSQGDN